MKFMIKPGRLLMIPAAAALMFMGCRPAFQPADAVKIHENPQVFPDFSDTVIPPNIAPVNFVIQEEGTAYFAALTSETGTPVEISSRDSVIQWPLKKWKALLAGNIGQSLSVEIAVRDSAGQWKQYNALSLKIADEAIDGYLVYRRIKPLFRRWMHIGIYQRNLETFKESPVLLNKTLDYACMNCHTPYQNSADDFLMHMRGGPGTGMLLSQNGSAVKIKTGTSINSHAAYTAWHPNKKLLAFSTNQVTQFFHAVGENRDVIDHASDLFLYHIDSNTVTTSPRIAGDENMETYPEWSPDGQHLYFCSTPQVDMSAETSVDYHQIRYDLKRISYDAQTGAWGEVEMILSSAETGLSISQPRISPDGRLLLFCMAEYGNFPVFRPGSDLYLMTLETGEYEKLAVNSDKSDSYHSWSDNGRWIVFSSKRRDGLRARPHFCYVDSAGQVYKSFVMPQKDPQFYQDFFETYNRPEFITERIRVRPQQLTEAACHENRQIQAKADSEVEISGSVSPVQKPWKSGAVN